MSLVSKNDTIVRLSVISHVVLLSEYTEYAEYEYT